jgi:lysozyme
MNLIGPDVSFYQDDNATERTVDFAKMGSNAGFVIIRSGQNFWADPDFKLNWQAAKGVLPRGSYWFYDSRVEPKRQADLWVSLFEGDFGELPLFADFEDNYGGAYGKWQDWYTLIERLRVLVPNKEIGIYTAYYYWLERTVAKGIPAASLEYFKQYPLWVANYGVDKPLIPKPWTDWLFWQYTDKGDGSLYGVESKNIDLNYFNGDMDAFNRRFKIDTPPAKPAINSLLVSLENGEQIKFIKQGAQNDSTI